MTFHPGLGEFDVVSDQHPTFARFMSKNSAADPNFLDVAPATSIADPAAPSGCGAIAEATGEHASIAPNAVWQPRINATHLSKGVNGIWYLRLAITEHSEDQDAHENRNALWSAGSTRCAMDAARGMPRSLLVNITKPSFDAAEAIAKARKPGLLPHCHR